MNLSIFRPRPLVFTLALLGGMGAALAQNNTQGTFAAADRQFAEQTAADGAAEVQAAQAAQQKSTSEPVRQFAARMIADHGKANDELGRIAGAKGLTLPSAPDAKHRATMDKMGQLSGGEFDRSYMKMMVADHTKAVASFQRQASSGQDAELKRFAAETLPTLQDHLKSAQQIDRTLGAPAARGQSGTDSRPGSTGTSSQ